MAKIDTNKMKTLMRDNPQIGNTELARIFGVSTNAVKYQKKVMAKRGEIKIIPLKLGRPIIEAINQVSNNELSEEIDKWAVRNLEGTVAIIESKLPELKKKLEAVGGLPGIAKLTPEGFECDTHLTSHNIYKLRIYKLPVSQYQNCELLNIN